MKANATYPRDLVDNQVLPGTKVSPEQFWNGLAEMVRDLGPKLRGLLKKRDELQRQIDAWHTSHNGTASFKF